jgi:hypothetical protein
VPLCSLYAKIRVNTALLKCFNICTYTSQMTFFLIPIPPAPDLPLLRHLPIHTIIMRIDNLQTRTLRLPSEILMNEFVEHDRGAIGFERWGAGDFQQGQPVLLFGRCWEVEGARGLGAVSPGGVRQHCKWGFN